jgi:small subunit ribosomal protein S16
MSRGGRKGRPFYKVVVADKRMPRDGRFIEKLGTYNPLLANDDDKRFMFNEERMKYWLGQGAQPSERVARFLGKAGLIDMPEIRETPKKSAPGKKARLRVEDKAEKKKAAEEEAKAAKEEAKAAAEAPKEEAAPAEEAPAEENKAEEAPAAEEAKAEEAPKEEAKEEPKAE